MWLKPFFQKYSSSGKYFAESHDLLWVYLMKIDMDIQPHGTEPDPCIRYFKYLLLVS